MASVNSDVALVAEAQGHLPAAEAATRKALDAARRLGLGLPESQLHARLGNLAMEQGDDEAAEALHERALALGEKLGSRLGVAFALVGRATVRTLTGRLDEAAADATEALARYRSSESPIGNARGLSVLGFVEARRGRFDEARRLHRDVLERVLDREARLTAQALEGLAGVAVAQGQGEQAAVLLGRAGQLRRETGGAPASRISDVDRTRAAAIGLLGEPVFAATAGRGSLAPTTDVMS
jgi:ATP/maltotriose-dependent transcriptional regulator MalT